MDRLLELQCIGQSDIVCTVDGFVFCTKSLSDILSEKNITHVPNASGKIIACDRYFDDWFLYCVNGTYSLVKMREQEHDGDEPADGDDPGVTVSFIAMRYEILLDCLLNPTEERKQNLCNEINRVAAYMGQKHDKILKQYFVKSESSAPYLIISEYTKLIATFAQNGILETPEGYRKIYRRGRAKRLPNFIDSINEKAGYTVCDHEKIFIRDPASPTALERLAIMATHTGNTSVHSFAAEVQMHAKFLTPLAKFPFFGKTLYDSAIRADMTACDTENQSMAPFYRQNSRIVKKQIACHMSEGF